MGKLAPNRARAWVSVAVCAALALSVVGGVAYGKYVYSQQADQAVRAKEFYFTSNLLAEDGNNVTLAPGTQEIEFTIGNHADDLRFSEVDVSYEVTVVDVAEGEGSAAGAGATTSGEGSANSATTNGEGSTSAQDNAIDEPAAASEVDEAAAASQDDEESRNVASNTICKPTVSPSLGTLTPNVKSDATITLSGLQDGHTYTVTAIGRGGYEKTLSCTITVLAENPVVYKYVDATNSAYVLLTVWSKNYAGSVQITYPASVVPDNTDSVMRDWKSAGADTNADTATVTDNTSFAADASVTGASTQAPSPLNADAGGYYSHTYRFFKTAAAVSVSDFSVKYCAVGSADFTEDAPTKSPQGE